MTSCDKDLNFGYKNNIHWGINRHFKDTKDSTEDKGRNHGPANTFFTKDLKGILPKKVRKNLMSMSLRNYSN